MKVSPISYNYHAFSKNTPKNNQCNRAEPRCYTQNNAELPSYKLPVSFKGNNRLVSEKTGLPLDTYFYRDYGTLKQAAEILQNTFPDGADILDYACSIGEETLSIYSLLNDGSDKFRIMGLDDSFKAVNYARNGVYNLSPFTPDSFLQGNGHYDNEEEKKMINHFKNLVDPYDRETYVTKENVREKLDYKLGSIFDVDDLEPKGPVGAIFFRNAFYHTIGALDVEKIFSKPQKNTEDLNEDINMKKRQETANEIVQKVYDKLDVGGIFVIGDSEADRIFLAGKDTPEEDTIKLNDTSFFNNIKSEYPMTMEYFINSSLQYMNDIYKFEAKNLEMTGEARILKKTPLETALENNGKFVRVYNSNEPIDNTPYTSTTIWQKVE